MKAWKKGAVIGGLWGVISLILLYWWSQYLGNVRLVGSTYIPNEGSKVLLIRIIVLPAYIASKFTLVPAAGVLILFPLTTILIGAFIGYIFGKFLGER